MKELQVEFTGRGEVRDFQFKQLQKSDKGFIYEVNTGHSKHFEVFEKVENKQYNCISYPKSGSFGLWAWCISNYEQAILRFNEL